MKTNNRKYAGVRAKAAFSPDMLINKVVNNSYSKPNGLILYDKNNDIVSAVDDFYSHMVAKISKEGSYSQIYSENIYTTFRNILARNAIFLSYTDFPEEFNDVALPMTLDGIMARNIALTPAQQASLMLVFSRIAEKYNIKFAKNIEYDSKEIDHILVENVGEDKYMDISSQNAMSILSNPTIINIFEDIDNRISNLNKPDVVYKVTPPKKDNKGEQKTKQTTFTNTTNIVAPDIKDLVNEKVEEAPSDKQVVINDEPKPDLPKLDLPKEDPDFNARRERSDIIREILDNTYFAYGLEGAIKAHDRHIIPKVVFVQMSTSKNTPRNENANTLDLIEAIRFYNSRVHGVKNTTESICSIISSFRLNGSIFINIPEFYTLSSDNNVPKLFTVQFDIAIIEGLMKEIINGNIYSESIAYFIDTLVKLHRGLFKDANL